MIDQTLLPDLLRRVKAATGVDQKLDAEICDCVGATPKLTGPVDPRVGPVKIYPLITSSLDAALGLCERVLPLATGKTGEWIWSLRHQAMGGHLATVAQLGEASPYGICEQAEHASPALALLAAALQALISNTQDDGEHT